MATKTFVNPTDEAWDVNLAWDNTEVDANGDLAVVSGESEGWRASNGWDPELGAVVDSSLVEWTATGDAGGEVAVSETDPTSGEGDGVDDYITVPYHSDLDLTGGGTIELWSYVRSAGASNFPRLVDKSSELSSTSGGWSVYLWIENGWYRLGMQDLAGFEINIIYNEWVHLAFTMDGSEWKLYTNGTLAETITTTTLPPVDDIDLRMFDHAIPENDRNMDGYMHDVRIWSSVRSQQEIADNMYELSGDTTDLVANWKLDEGTGTTAGDSSGNNHDGTLTGISWAPGQSGLYRPATSGQPIPGISQGDDLSGKKIYGRQLLNDANATMQEFKLQVSTAEEVVANIAAFRRMTTIGSGTH